MAESAPMTNYVGSKRKKKKRSSPATSGFNRKPKKVKSPMT